MVDGDENTTEATVTKREMVLDALAMFVIFSAPFVAFWVKYVFFD